MNEQLNSFNEHFQKLNSKEIERFQQLTNKLIHVNYLTSWKEEDKSDYFFIISHLEVFQNYFLLGGRELNNYEQQKTLVLDSIYAQKLSLGKINSSILLFLRLLYHQKLQDISLDNSINITIADIHNFSLEFALFDRIKVGELSEALRLFKKHNIINYRGQDFKDDDMVITIYPTVLYAVGIDNIQLIYKKLETYKTKEEENEEIDENQID